MLRRFIIAALGRSGTADLVQAIDRHPQARCLGEVLRPSYPGAWRRQTEGIEQYLARTGWSPAECGCIAAAGFKWFPVHPGLEYLAGLKDLHVILLRRKNLLERFVSLVTTRASTDWKAPFHDRIYDVRFSVRPKALGHQLNRAVRLYRQMLRRFKDHPHVEVTYEDLFLRNGQGWDKITDLLGLLPCDWPLDPADKREKRPMREVLSNFDELAAAFAATPYAWMFRRSSVSASGSATAGNSA